MAAQAVDRLNAQRDQKFPDAEDRAMMRHRFGHHGEVPPPSVSSLFSGTKRIVGRVHLRFQTISRIV